MRMGTWTLRALDPAVEIAQTAITPYKYLRPLPSDADAEEPGENESGILLQAIVIVARREQTS
jgi:hypothetical protein